MNLKVVVVFFAVIVQTMFALKLRTESNVMKLDSTAEVDQLANPTSQTAQIFCVMRKYRFAKIIRISNTNRIACSRDQKTWNIH